MTEHRGEIVIAEPQDTTRNSLYKLVARIATGPLSGNMCYVAHRGDVSTISGSFIIRVDNPFMKFVDSSVREHSTYGYFVTSSMPSDFEYSHSENLVLYGLWLERMKGGFDVPGIGRISNFFDIGRMSRVIHYSNRNGFSIPYDMCSGSKPIIMSSQDGRVKSIGSALRKYLRRFTLEHERDPRVVTIDGTNQRLERLVLDEIKKIGLKYIEMQPQQ